MRGHPGPAIGRPEGELVPRMTIRMKAIYRESTENRIFRVFAGSGDPHAECDERKDSSRLRCRGGFGDVSRTATHRDIGLCRLRLGSDRLRAWFDWPG